MKKHVRQVNLNNLNPKIQQKDTLDTNLEVPNDDLMDEKLKPFLMGLVDKQA